MDVIIAPFASVPQEHGTKGVPFYWLLMQPSTSLIPVQLLRFLCHTIRMWKIIKSSSLCFEPVLQKEPSLI